MERPFNASLYEEEFAAFLPTVAVSDRCPLNTEMFFLWCMIRTSKPTLFIESGAYRGYSAAFICEALKRNNNGAEFITYGYDSQGCLRDARQRLSRYRFAQVIEGDSRKHLSCWATETRPTAFFVDGPKGRNMPPLFYTIDKQFGNKVFLAVHDCEPESGSGNRWYLETFWSPAYPIIYCDSTFQTSCSSFDEALAGEPESSHWKPYHLHGKRRVSYGTETGFVLFGSEKPGTPFSRFSARVYRYMRFRVVQKAANKVRMLRRRS